MNIDQVLAQVDVLFEENKGKEAEKLMGQSIEQAIREQDDAGLLQLLNELLGYYRETSQRENAMQIASQAIAQAKRMGLEGTIPYATTLQNVANACRACDRLQDSMEYYLQAQDIYARLLPPDDMLMAGLKNNMSLLYQEMGNFAGAKEMLLGALDIVARRQAPYELGVTYANLAGTCMQLGEVQEAGKYALKATEIFREENVADSHYAAALAVLGAFFYHGKELEKALQYYRQASEIVERSLGRNEYYRRLQEYVADCQKALEANGGAGIKKAEIHNAEANEAGMHNAKVSNAGVGIGLAREYYEAFGRQMIAKNFPAYEDRIAVGLAGRGSDCLGYDDEASRDHDWGPGFCMWVTEETYAEIGEALQQAYEELPREFKGYGRAPHVNGRNRRGVIRISDFYRDLTGADTYGQIDWRQVADASLAAAISGEIFRDEEGIFTAFRQKLQQGYPEDIRYLKLAESAAGFAQAAQYNFPRMLERGDGLTAHMMAWDGLKEAMKLQHYIEGKYPPHDKWLYRSLQESAAGREAATLLKEVEAALAEGDKEIVQGTGDSAHPAKDNAHPAGDNVHPAKDNAHPAGDNVHPAKDNAHPAGDNAAILCIEQLGAYLARELYQKGYISDTESYLDAHSEELVYKASLAPKDDSALVEEIVKLEFEAFDKVKNEGGRASCQNDWPTFYIMRKSQYLTWDRQMLMQYLYDFRREYHRGHNLIEEKYGRMMESTAPEAYEKIKGRFPELSQEKRAIIEQIVRLQVGWMEEFAGQFPALADNARSIHTWEDYAYDTSYETYLRGEIGTYSDKMLELYGRYVVGYARNGKNPAYDIMENSIKMYGYASPEEANRKIAKEKR